MSTQRENATLTEAQQGASAAADDSSRAKTVRGGVFPVR